MDITHITSLLGGIALFLYGMSIMGAGLEKLAGGKMQGVLQKLTSSTLKAVIFGTLITGVIQSSAGTVVICVGLVNSGIMTLTQSVGVIMGANIGTTVTGQLIRMADISGESLLLTLIQPKTFAPVVAFVGCVFYVFIRNAKKKNIGQIMLGFGILFTGMSLMDTGVSPLRESAAFQELFVSMTNPILGVLVGVVVTVIIQSSSASVGILPALSPLARPSPSFWARTLARRSPRCSPSAALPRMASAQPSSIFTLTSSAASFCWPLSIWCGIPLASPCGAT